MNKYWSQPSLSRDFALLSAAVFCVLFMVSLWVTFVTFNNYSKRIADDLQAEAKRIEHTLAGEMESANYLLNALGRQIVVNNARDTVELAQILKSFDAKEQIYAVFNWINVDQKIIVSSSVGILDKPVDVSDRDFVKKTFADPWKMHIGRPIEGRISGRWVIPVAMGLTDYTGKFIGTLIISLDISQLTERVSNLVKRRGIDFAIISKTLIPLTQVSEDKDFLNHNFPAQLLINIDYANSPQGIVSKGNMFLGTGNYSYYSSSADYPYIILLSYNAANGDDAVHNMLWSRLLQMVVIAAFFILFLLVVRSRMIAPILLITESIAKIARGDTNVTMPKAGPVEINALAEQAQRLCEYIEENKRVEDELRNKMFMLRRSNKEIEVAMHSKAEFLAYICQEMRSPVNQVMGYAQIMKDQIYGPIENKKYRQFATDIYSGCNHVIMQLDQVLELAKIEAHYEILRESTIDVTSCLAQAVSSISARLESANIKVSIRCEDPTLLLYADEFRIQQMAGNALLFMLEQELADCEVTISVRTVMERKSQQNVEIIFSYPANSLKIRDSAMQNTRLELLLRLAELHQGSLHITGNGITVILPGTRLRFAEM